MSVPASLRSESKLEVIIQARSLASYTINITKNQKTFPPEYNNGITNNIIETATNIYMNCWTANNIYVDSIEDMQERLWLQEKACNDCYNAWKAHASHGNNYQIIMRMDAYYKSLWKGENNGTN